MFSDKIITNEKTLSQEFLKILKTINPKYEKNFIIHSFLDGQYNGILFEFKKKFKDALKSKTLIECIKNASNLRRRAKDVPATFALTFLGDKKIYIYDALDFFDEIHKIYETSASKEENISLGTRIVEREILDYGKDGFEVITNFLNREKSTAFIKVNIDRNNVVMMAERFYNENNTKKKDFYNELIEPKVLKYIKPFAKDREELAKKSVEQFPDLLDCINDMQLKKETGAFYTPAEYVKLSTEMVRDAIKRIKKGWILKDGSRIAPRPLGEGLGERVGEIRDEIGDSENPNPLPLPHREGERHGNLNPLCPFNKEEGRCAEKQVKGNDYIILDRCAGTGNLEQFFTDEELSHTICSTYEVWEWEVLNERFKSDIPNKFGQYTKLRLLIPPKVFIEKQRANIVNMGQTIIGGDALSEHFITGKIGGNTNLLSCISDIAEKNLLNEEYIRAIEQLNSYVKDENCNVIVYENPPYKETLSGKIKFNDDKTNLNTYIYKQFVDKKITDDGAGMRDMCNLFIWSALEYYLKKKNDFLIMYSPVKYFKSYNYCNKKFVKGYALNRGFFGEAGESTISLVTWQNINEYEKKEYNLQVIDIVNGEWQEVKDNKNDVYMNVKKVYKQLSNYYDKNIQNGDIISDISCTPNGYEIKVDDKNSTSYNSNIVAYLFTGSFAVDVKNVNLLTRFFYIKARGGFYLRSDNFIQKLPLFCAKLYPQEKWYERDVYFTTADKGDEYTKDKQFLKSCLIYTCLTNRNKCRSFKGSDKRDYYNELCLLHDTLSDGAIGLKYNKNTKLYETKKEYKLNDTDQSILAKWQLVLDEAKRLEPKLNKWGLYQIEQELLDKKKSDKKDTKTTIKDETTDELYYGETEQEIIEMDNSTKKDCSNLVQYIKELKESLKSYYKSEIQEKLFEYELLK